MLKKWGPLLLLGGFLAGGFWYLQGGDIEWHPEDVQAWFLSFGWWAPLLYILFYALRPLVLFPSSLYAMAGGLAFGLWAVPLTYIGSVTGSTIAFWISRLAGFRIVRAKWTGRMAVVQRQLEKNGFYYILFLRLIPVLNFDIVSYLSGISKVKYRSFLAATLVGIIPGAFGFTFLGAGVVEGEPTIFIIGISVIIVMLLIPVIVRKKAKGRAAEWIDTTEEKNPKQP
ncbi:putative membrane protein YdjX (TVP38/TMEM64 family) [Salsuginibacillus halophilus]|uniref:TVP38/TMEM64 family membrane protein n=1 Tax=Salsuginibacillus halophilus TaxID=517424 RepID=A0A2P8H893_9BACI|nr:TVP38/TMEM64 family protein [Salsuginibacillus halophilus]PSL42438.1 putative membrane protein YdjX (TVP38/TMEM64 family) [Salsuginibacillus halophilus]